MVDSATQKRINRNNRKRGGNFEKVVADLLDMDIVPYSGSNSRFGYGDVRDSIWLGECKNITLDNGAIVIRREWLRKNTERAAKYNKIPFLAFMQYGAQDKYVIVSRDVIYKFESYLRNAPTDEGGGPWKIVTHQYILPRMSHNTVNYRLDPDKLKGLRPKYGIMETRLDGEATPVYTMHIGCFKMFMKMCKMKGQRSGDQCTV
jgi:hypothetical protein